jgi:putrescine transport system substrate-binding protein
MRSSTFVAMFVSMAFMSTSLYAQTQQKPAPIPDRIVSIYNWSDYIDPKVLADFTKETGIKVVYDTYDHSGTAEAKLLAGKSDYDIVVVPGLFLPRLIKAKAIQPIDRSRLSNGKNLWADIEARLQIYDPGNRYAVNYMWGTVGIGINVKLVKERLGALPVNSWDIVLKPQNAAKLKDCGIHMLDKPEDIIPSVLNAIGLKGDSKAEGDLRRAADALISVRASIRKFHSTEYINALANGDICVAVGSSGDVLQARKRAEEARNGIEIAYIAPKEGAQMWFDSMVIPADAPNLDHARIFIDFMLRADVAARNVNLLAYASGVGAARPLVRFDILANPGIYPDEATFKRLFANAPFDDKSQPGLMRLWARVKAGR